MDRPDHLQLPWGEMSKTKHLRVRSLSRRLCKLLLQVAALPLACRWSWHWKTRLQTPAGPERHIWIQDTYFLEALQINNTALHSKYLFYFFFLIALSWFFYSHWRGLFDVITDISLYKYKGLYSQVYIYTNIKVILFPNSKHTLSYAWLKTNNP